jgi:hypothetical protein
MAFLCVSQQGEFKNTTKTFWGKSMSKAFGRKSYEKKKTFFLSSFPFGFLLSRFWPFLCMRSQKNTIKIFSKIRPKNLKTSQEKVGR